MLDAGGGDVIESFEYLTIPPAYRFELRFNLYIDTKFGLWLIHGCGL